MKKFAYTLAEVLITLSIVGVMAALTLPTVTASAQKQKNASSLSVAVSDWESAMAAMMSVDGANDIYETTLWQEIPKEINKNTADADKKKFFAGLAKHLNLVNYYSNFDALYGTGYKAKWVNGTTDSSLGNNLYNSMPLISKKGFVYSIKVIDSISGTSSRQVLEEDENGVETVVDNIDNTEAAVTEAGGNLYNYTAIVYIDVNGKDKPNTFGRDIFQFFLGSDGILYPQGGMDISVFLRGDNRFTWKNGKSYSQCSNIATASGLECTARLVENGFKMDY